MHYPMYYLLSFQFRLAQKVNIYLSQWTHSIASVFSQAWRHSAKSRTSHGIYCAVRLSSSWNFHKTSATLGWYLALDWIPSFSSVWAPDSDTLQSSPDDNRSAWADCSLLSIRIFRRYRYR